MPDEEFNLCDQQNAMKVLAEERVRIGMSLGDLEEKSGVSTNSFYAWQSKARAPQLPLLVALAQTLGFDVILRRRNRASEFD